MSSTASQGSADTGKTDRAEVLLRMYEEHRRQRRHHASLRGTITHCVLVLATAGIAMKELGDLTPADLGKFLVFIGLFGAVFTWEQAKDCQTQMNCAGLYRKKLEEIFGEEEEQSIRIKRSVAWYAKYFDGSWVVINSSVLLLGIICLL